ncbi:MAG: AraC family transcriptional regulator [Rhodocyclaceae bacterium]
MDAELNVQDIRFHNPRLARLGVEVLTLADLRTNAAGALAGPQRVDFHLLLLIEGGRSQHMVDFVDHVLQPGRVVLIRPGQIQRWHMQAGLDGLLVLIANDALAPLLTRSENALALLQLEAWPPACTPSDGLFAAVCGDFHRMREEIAGFAGDAVDSAIIRLSLRTALLRLSREALTEPAGTPGSRETMLYRLLVREIEVNLDARLSVLDYARRIGYSERTLARACIATVGLTAKVVIDQRVALEAKRLLHHSPASVARIGHQLGFTEPTNFVKFFRRLVGMTPQAFREHV